METKISRRDVARATALLDRLRNYEEALGKLKAGSGLRVHNAVFITPSRAVSVDGHEKQVDHQALSSVLSDLGIDPEMMSMMVLDFFASEADRKIRETRTELEKLGVGMD